MTVKNWLEDTRYNMACTFIVRCLGEEEVFTRETKKDLVRIWGLEEARFSFINTREVCIDII